MSTYPKNAIKKVKGNKFSILVILPISIIFALAVGYIFRYFTSGKSIFLLIFSCMILLSLYKPFWGVLTILFLTLLKLSMTAETVQTITMNRVIGIIIVVALLAATAHTKRSQFRIVGIQTYLLAAYVLTAIMSLVFSPGGLTFAAIRELFISFGMYFLVVNVLKKRQELTHIALTAMICGMISLIYYFIFRPESPSHERISSLLGNPNSLASVCYLSFNFILFFLVNTKNAIIKVVLFSCSIFLLYGIALTGSRGAFVAVIVTLFFMFLRTRKYIFTTGVFAVIIVLFVTLSSLETTKRLVNIQPTLEVQEIKDPSARNRVLTSVIALKMFVDHPIIGVGFGNFIEESTSQYAAESRVSSTVAHDIITSTIAEMGIIGLVVVLSILSVGLKDFFDASAMLRKEKDSKNSEFLWMYGITYIGILVFMMTHGSTISRFTCIFLAVGAASRHVLAVPPAEEQMRK